MVSIGADSCFSITVKYCPNAQTDTIFSLSGLFVVSEIFNTNTSTIWRCFQEQQTKRSISLQFNFVSRLKDCSTAFKFESTPEEALRNMGAWAGALNSSAPSDFLHSLGSLFLPFLETKPPTRWSAVYFPVWIINLEADGESTNGERHTCHLGNE